MSAKLGFKIRYFRKKLGLTQYQLADMVSADVSTISKIEKSKATPSLSMLQRIAGALGVSVNELLKERINNGANCSRCWPRWPRSGRNGERAEGEGPHA
ncbi:helix-turn-helix transcriptional regulator [Geobacillus icigianus]|uniref:HTH cro/C1-type domain-containing protein n=1 Tax=Geobacillus subterraneus TaxID=129338 RepID=A0A679FJV2_9BACL|nr:hypothetical protein GsuE55_13610 [Geobacillus subterraneus]